MQQYCIKIEKQLQAARPTKSTKKTSEKKAEKKHEDKKNEEKRNKRTAAATRARHSWRGGSPGQAEQCSHKRRSRSLRAQQKEKEREESSKVYKSEGWLNNNVANVYEKCKKTKYAYASRTCT